jgi:tellurite resistance protein TehA-like permease
MNFFLVFLTLYFISNGIILISYLNAAGNVSIVYQIITFPLLWVLSFIAVLIILIRNRITLFSRKNKFKTIGFVLFIFLIPICIIVFFY